MYNVYLTGTPNSPSLARLATSVYRLILGEVMPVVVSFARENEDPNGNSKRKLNESVDYATARKRLLLTQPAPADRRASAAVVDQKQIALEEAACQKALSKSSEDLSYSTGQRKVFTAIARGESGKSCSCLCMTRS